MLLFVLFAFIVWRYEYPSDCASLVSRGRIEALMSGARDAPNEQFTPLELQLPYPCYNSPFRKEHVILAAMMEASTPLSENESI